MDIKKHMVYALIDELGSIFYIGKTVNFKSRMRKHRSEALKGNTLPVYRKLKKVLTIIEKIDKCSIILESNILEKNIDEREMYFIKKIRESGIKLKNLTNGGEGGKGLTRYLIQKAVNTKKKNGTNFHSDKTKKKMSDASKGVPKSKEHKKALSKGWEKRKLKFPNGISESHRLNASKTSKGKINIKIYKVTNPDGKIFYTNNGLTLFCEQNNLTQANMHKVSNGLRPHHKGWKCELLN